VYTESVRRSVRKVPEVYACTKGVHKVPERTHQRSHEVYEGCHISFEIDWKNGGRVINIVPNKPFGKQRDYSSSREVWEGDKISTSWYLESGQSRSWILLTSKCNTQKDLEIFFNPWRVLKQAVFDLVLLLGVLHQRVNSGGLPNRKGKSVQVRRSHITALDPVKLRERSFLDRIQLPNGTTLSDSRHTPINSSSGLPNSPCAHMSYHLCGRLLHRQLFTHLLTWCLFCKTPKHGTDFQLYSIQYINRGSAVDTVDARLDQIFPPWKQSTKSTLDSKVSCSCSMFLGYVKNKRIPHSCRGTLFVRQGTPPPTRTDHLVFGGKGRPQFEIAISGTWTISIHGGWSQPPKSVQTI